MTELFVQGFQCEDCEHKIHTGKLPPQMACPECKGTAYPLVECNGCGDWLLWLPALESDTEGNGFKCPCGHVNH